MGFIPERKSRSIPGFICGIFHPPFPVKGKSYLIFIFIFPSCLLLCKNPRVLVILNLHIGLNDMALVQQPKFISSCPE